MAEIMELHTKETQNKSVKDMTNEIKNNNNNVLHKRGMIVTI